MKSYFNLLLATLFLVSAVACSSDDSSGGGNTGGNIKRIVTISHLGFLQMCNLLLIKPVPLLVAMFLDSDLGTLLRSME